MKLKLAAAKNHMDSTQPPYMLVLLKSLTSGIPGQVWQHDMTLTL